MKNFSISYATARAEALPTDRRPVAFAGALVALLVLLVLLLTLAAPAAAKKRPAPEDLMNPLLGLEYSHWLVGPMSEIADEDERQAYLELTSDEEAKRFITEFWEKRAEGTPVFTKTPLQVYEARAAEADKRFTEAAYPGRRTDRGTTFILYGEPETIEFRSPDRVGDPTLEVWVYGKGAEPGLGGESPRREYRFWKNGELTRFYDGSVTRPDPLRRPHRGFHR